MFDNDSYGRALKVYLKQGLAMLQATRDGALIGEVLTLISTSYLDPDPRVGVIASIHGVKSEDGVWYAPVLTIRAFASDGDTITGDVDQAVLALPLVSGARTQLYEESLPEAGPMNVTPWKGPLVDLAHLWVNRDGHFDWERFALPLGFVRRVVDETLDSTGIRLKHLWEEYARAADAGESCVCELEDFSDIEPPAVVPPQVPMEFWFLGDS
jgi:hypothetical protein